jgi:rhamnosyltransferase
MKTVINKITNTDLIIIGSRGLFKNYGGWEYYLNNLFPNLSNSLKNFNFHFINFSSDKKELKVSNIHKNIYIHTIFLKKETNMVIKDLKAFFYFINKIKSSKIIYFLGVRIGIPIFFLSFLYKKKDIWIFNPAGIEWKRKKFPLILRLYLFFSAFLMTKCFNFIVSDSFSISTYYVNKFKFNKKRIFTIPYGVYLDNNLVFNSEVLKNYKIHENEYYIIVSRFVPENSYEILINSFIKSNSRMKLVIVSNFSKEFKFFNFIRKRYSVENNPNIILLESLYDNKTLKTLRYYAYAYINGNQLGGTNPGLLEAMITSKRIIAYDSVFAREVIGEHGYFFKDDKDLTDIFKSDLNKSFSFNYQEILEERYTWENIINLHINLFNFIKGSNHF